MMDRDGRPQGSTPPHPHRPRPYYTPISVAPCFEGAGAHPCSFEQYWPQGPHPLRYTALMGRLVVAWSPVQCPVYTYPPIYTVLSTRVSHSFCLITLRSG